MLNKINRVYVGIAVGAFTSLMAQATMMSNWENSGDAMGEFSKATFWHHFSVIQFICSSAILGFLGFLIQRNIDATRDEKEMLDYVKAKKENKSINPIVK